MTNKEAIERLKWVKKRISDITYSPESFEALNLAIKALENEPKNGKWISVSERLSEEKLLNPSGSDFGFDFEEVLCTTIWGDVRAYKFGKPIGHDKPHFWLGGGIMDEYIIAWQPFPEPYKEADNG